MTVIRYFGFGAPYSSCPIYDYYLSLIFFFAPAYIFFISRIDEGLSGGNSRSSKNVEIPASEWSEDDNTPCQKDDNVIRAINRFNDDIRIALKDFNQRVECIAREVEQVLLGSGNNRVASNGDARNGDVSNSPIMASIDVDLRTIS